MKEMIKVDEYAKQITEVLAKGNLLNTNGDKFNTMVSGTADILRSGAWTWSRFPRKKNGISGRYRREARLESGRHANNRHKE